MKNIDFRKGIVLSLLSFGVVVSAFAGSTDTVDIFISYETGKWDSVNNICETTAYGTHVEEMFDYLPSSLAEDTAEIRLIVGKEDVGSKVEYDDPTCFKIEISNSSDSHIIPLNYHYVFDNYDDNKYYNIVSDVIFD